MKVSAITFLLFMAMFVVVPVFYYIVIAIGFLPLLYVTILGITSSNTSIVIWHFVGVALWTIPMMFLSFLLAKKIATYSPWHQLLLTIGAVLLLLAAGLLPFFGAGHEM